MVFSACAAVFIFVAAVSATEATAALPVTFAHHSLRPFMVTCLKALFLLSVSATFCSSIVIVITDCTFFIIRCKSSFSSAKSDISADAADKPLTTPDKPDIIPPKLGISLAKAFPCACMSPCNFISWPSFCFNTSYRASCPANISPEPFTSISATISFFTCCIAACRLSEDIAFAFT